MAPNDQNPRREREAAGVERVEGLSLWTGVAGPPSRAAKLTITPGSGDRFVRERALAGSDELPGGAVADVLAALSREPVPELDPSLFDVPERALRSHYGSMWTDD